MGKVAIPAHKEIILSCINIAAQNNISTSYIKIPVTFRNWCDIFLK